MQKMKRLFYYLLINILVSACTTLVVLGLWEKTHPLTSGANLLSFRPLPTQAQAVENPLPGASSTQEVLPTNFGPTPVITTTGQAASTPANVSLVKITNVFGVGDLATERVRLERQGTGDLAMANWKLADEDGHVYIFPSLVLYTGGAVDLYTQAGSDKVVSLYWGLDQAIWRSGEKVTLVDNQGTVRATYMVP